jgi:hypothetical protein
MARQRWYLLLVVSTLPVLTIACNSAQDRTDRRRARAEQACQDAVMRQLSSRATAQFAPDSEHVFYDSLGAAAVTGVVTTVARPRKFACILNPATDTTWTLSAARLLD